MKGAAVLVLAELEETTAKPAHVKFHRPTYGYSNIFVIHAELKMRSQNVLMSQGWCFWEAPLLMSCILCGENALNIEQAFCLSTENVSHGCPRRHFKESFIRGNYWPVPVGSDVGSLISYMAG